LLVQVEMPPVLVSSLITPSVIGDNAKRPFSPSGIGSAHAAASPPRQDTIAVAATKVDNFEGEVSFIMGVLRLKTD
jgi:hypothetical protein